MAMVDHRTESIYRRYAIADEGMLKESAAKLAALHALEKALAPQESLSPFDRRPGMSPLGPARH
jgi:hypothetical protein